MTPSKRDEPGKGLRNAFDEVRFGRQRTLNLRESLPTGREAATRAETWLRQRQVENAGEVLIVTGRGNRSLDGIPVVREAVARLLHQLKRKGVVLGHQEHTQGSFVVTLAPVHALWEAPKRQRDKSAPRASPPSLDALDQNTRALLLELAERSLDRLGVRDRESFLQAEMLRQFSAIAANVPAGPEREARLRAAIRVAMDQDE